MRIRALLGPPLLLGLLWVGAIWWPSQMAISSADEQAERATSEQLALIADIERLDQSSTQQSDLEADLSAIARSIPSDPQVDAFLATLAAAAEQNGVRVNLVSPTGILDSATSDPNRPVPTGMSSVGIALEAEGSFEDVMRFTSSLDDLERLVVIDEIGMVALEGATQVIIIDVSLRIFASTTSSQTAIQEPGQ